MDFHGFTGVMMSRILMSSLGGCFRCKGCYLNPCGNEYSFALFETNSEFTPEKWWERETILSFWGQRTLFGDDVSFKRGKTLFLFVGKNGCASATTYRIM